MSRHRARIAKAEQQLQAGIPPEIIILWPGDPEPPQKQPGEKRTIIRVVYTDKPAQKQEPTHGKPARQRNSQPADS